MTGYTHRVEHSYTGNRNFDRLCFAARDWGKLQTTHFILRFYD
jgi:hypothetical protein